MIVFRHLDNQNFVPRFDGPEMSSKLVKVFFQVEIKEEWRSIISHIGSEFH